MAVNSQVQIVRGTTEKAGAYVGKIGELVYDIDKKTVRALDGATAGGTVLAKEGIKLKTDTEALLKFNAAAEADHSADVSITIDKAALAAKLVSTKADNALSVTTGTGADGLLFVEKQDIDNLIATGEQAIYAKTEGTNKKLATNLKLVYTAATGMLGLYGGSAGTTKIDEVEVPTSLTLLKKVETVVDPSGKPAGTYMHFVFETQSGVDNEVYMSAADFDIYTGGDGIKMNATDDHKIEIDLATAGNQAKIDSGKLLVPTDYGTLD